MGLECNPSSCPEVAWRGRPRPGRGRGLGWEGGMGPQDWVRSGLCPDGDLGRVASPRGTAPIGRVPSSAAQEAGGSVQPVELVY